MSRSRYEIVADRSTAARFLARWYGIREAAEILGDENRRRSRRRIALPRFGVERRGYSTRRAADADARVVAEIAAHQAGRMGKPLTLQRVEVEVVR